MALSLVLPHLARWSSVSRRLTTQPINFPRTWNHLARRGKRSVIWSKTRGETRVTSSGYETMSTNLRSN
jgi:uncharacterized cupin superfamily protein